VDLGTGRVVHVLVLEVAKVTNAVGQHWKQKNLHKKERSPLKKGNVEMTEMRFSQGAQ
jgi:hypothetical protein